MKKILAVCALLAMSSSVAFADGFSEMGYPGPWSNEFNKSIIKTLIKHQVRGCGELVYREHDRYNNEYIVKCTGYKQPQTIYIAWTAINKIQGPYAYDPSYEN